MIGIVDYNAGNITSVKHSLEFLKADYVLSKNPLDLKNVDKIIFPGVGDASYAMGQLKATGFDTFLKEFYASGKPMIGICLGSQIVFESSEEGDVQCLGLIPGKIKYFSDLLKNNVITEKILEDVVKIPHMGWNNIEICNGGSKLLNGVENNSNFYFVHSYVIQPEDSSVVKGYANYGIKIPSIIEKNNLTVFQFHPEKSGRAGLKILENFVQL